MKIAPVVAENKRRPIWGWSIQAKRTVVWLSAVRQLLGQWRSGGGQWSAIIFLAGNLFEDDPPRPPHTIPTIHNQTMVLYILKYECIASHIIL
jgi:hypothetical protein